MKATARARGYDHHRRYMSAALHAACSAFRAPLSLSDFMRVTTCAYDSSRRKPKSSFLAGLEFRTSMFTDLSFCEDIFLKFTKLLENMGVRENLGVQ